MGNCEACTSCAGEKKVEFNDDDPRASLTTMQLNRALQSKQNGKYVSKKNKLIDSLILI